MKKFKKESMEKTFEFNNYSVIITENSIQYLKDNLFYHVPSEFNNKYDEKTGEIIIENIHLRFNCIYPYERKQMFDFIARGYNIDMKTPEKHLKLREVIMDIICSCRNKENGQHINPFREDINNWVEQLRGLGQK